ncbi:MAG: TrkH family potassium uptake protein [Candidatus Methanoplasma sp.]|jgi:trk system potassium uptake protein TrkH|nr:TrkH family potassium uptake protein [Candidatus Methanoplasma sp.]
MFRALHVRITNRARWESSTVKVLGVIEIILGVILSASAVIALLYDEDPMMFVYPVPILLILGTLQYTFFRNGETLRPAGGMMMMFTAWWLAFFVSAVPFCLYGFSFTDSLFEGVSGFTTTGVTIMDGASIPYSLLFWRALIQWAGGIAVVLIFLFLIPMMGIGGKAFVNNEFAGSVTYNFSMRIKSAARNFISIYVLLSAAEVVLLVISGMGPFDAVTTMFSTISTGGFAAGGNSVAGQSFVIQVIVLAFMFLGGTNFYLHYRALKKREFAAYKKSQEFAWTVIWFLLATAAIIVILLISAGNIADIDIGNTIWDTLFTVVSMGTTTGYVIADQSMWPFAAYVIMWMVMLFGSMSGSTSGGIKIYRLLILRSYVSNGIYKMFHPRSVRDVRVDGHSVDMDAVVSATVVIMMFIVALIVSMIFLLVSEPWMTVSESAGLSISAISNTGINTGGVDVRDLSDVTRMFLSFMMWVGRLEVVLALLLFTRTFWVDLISDLRGTLQTAGKGRN